MFAEDLLAGQKILVTGGGTGLGRAMTERLMELGAEVVIWGRRKSVLDETAAELREKTGAVIHTQAVDIRDPDMVDEAVAEIWAAGPLTGLVNNAAGNFISRTEDLSPRAFDAIAGIVFHGTFYTTNACGKRWIAAGDKASVLSIVVTWVWSGSPYVVPSAMSKSGVATMTKSLAMEWGPKGIRLNAIAPGPFPTKGAWERLNPGQSGDDASAHRMDHNPMRRVGEHSELANLAAFLMADEVAYLTGQVIAIDGGESLTNGGTFARLDSLTDEDWTNIREQIKTANAADKAKRVKG